MAGLYIEFIFIAGFIARLNGGTVERIYIRDNKPTLKGSDIQLVCQMSQFTSGGLNIYKSDTQLLSSLAGVTSLTSCFPSFCPTATIGRYTFSTANKFVFINITNLNRSEDQKWWTCAIENQRKYLLLNVITVPTSLQYENPPSQGQDLAENAVQLKCRTGCSYPQPTISWYYSESGYDSLQIWTSSGNSSDTRTGCSDSERIYSSTLSLPRFTTFPGHLQNSIRFKCGIRSVTGLSHILYTSYSTDVQFAVQVSGVTIKDGSDIVSGQLQVVNGVSKTLTSATHVSRPAAIIVWYIGSAEKQRSTSNNFTFTPDNSDHNKKVYCKAFNTQTENQAVTSYKATLYVKVYATKPTLSNQTAGKLILLEKDSITMECVTSATRPAATVTWLKGSSYLTNIKNTNIVQGNLVSVKSVVTFTPLRSDDNKAISCQSFTPGQVNKSSAHQTVTVYWPPSTPTVSIIQFPLLEGDTGKNMKCSSKDYGNLASTAMWTKQYGIPNSTDSLLLNLPTLTSQMNGSPVSCQLHNYFTKVKGLTIKSSTIKLNVGSVPLSPELLYFFGLIDDVNNFLFVGSNNRGHLQTFVIETKEYGTSYWIEQLRFNETDKNYLQNDQMLYRFGIKGLIPGVYNIRVLAGNEYGWIDEAFAPTIQFTVSELEQKVQSGQKRPDDTAAIVGGSLSVLIVGMFAVVVFLIQKMRQKPDGKSTENTASSTYESLQTRHETSVTYSTLSPQTDGPDQIYENNKSEYKKDISQIP